MFPIGKGEIRREGKKDSAITTIAGDETELRRTQRNDEAAELLNRFGISLGCCSISSSESGADDANWGFGRLERKRKKKKKWIRDTEG